MDKGRIAALDTPAGLIRRSAGVTVITLRVSDAAERELVRRAARAKVLVLTTYDTDSDTLPAIEAGATGYLLKDAPRDELFTAVRAAAEGRTVLSPAVASRLVSAVRAPATSPSPPASARSWRWSPRAPPTVRSPANCSSARRP